MMTVKVATAIESSGGEEDEEEEEIEMTNLVESKVDSSDDDDIEDDDEEEEALIIVDGLPETAVDDDEDEDAEDDDEVELDVDDDDNQVNVTEDVDDEEVFVIPDTVSNQSSTESTMSTDNQFFTLSDLLDLITGVSPGVTDHLMEEFLVAYKFLLTDSRLTSVLPQLNQGGCQCDECRSNPTKLLVRHLIQRSCSFDLLLRLTLVWVNCFFNDFDGNFNYTRKILVRLKQIQLYQSQPQQLNSSEVHSQPLPSHPPPPLDKMDSDVEDDVDIDESEDTFDFDDIESDSTPRIESSLDLVSLALSLKSTARKISVPIDTFSRVTFDLGIESNFASASSCNLQVSTEALASSSFIQANKLSSKDSSDCSPESVNTSASSSNGLDNNESTVRLVFDPITGRVFFASNVKHVIDCCDSLLLREGDRLIAIDDVEISYSSLSNSPELEFKAVRELESKITNYIKSLTSAVTGTSNRSSSSHGHNKTIFIKVKYDPFAYNAISKRIKKRKSICNKRHSISSSISSYSTGYHSSVASNSRLTHPNFHSAGHHQHTHHHHHHHSHGGHAAPAGLTHSSSSSPSTSLNHIPSTPCSTNSYQHNHHHHHHHHQHHLQATPALHSNNQTAYTKTEREALQIFNAFKDGREHLLLVDEKNTTAREVVMILARDLFLSAASSLNTNSSFDQIRRKASLAALLSPSSGSSNSSNSASSHQTVAGLSSLDFALYELTVSYASGTSTGVIVRSRRISDTATNLWSSRSIFSRLLLKQIARNSSVISSNSNALNNDEDDGDSNSFENRIRKELVESYLKVKNKKSKICNEDEEYNPISLTDIEPMALALELTYHAFRLFSALDAQSILSSILSTSPGGGTSSSSSNNVHYSHSQSGNSGSHGPPNSASGKPVNHAHSSTQKNNFISAGKQIAGLEAWESLTEAEMFWAINEILRQSSSEDRVKCVKILIKTALICLLKLRNFSTAASITSALEHASIKRLKKTLWQPLKKKHKNLNDDLAKLNQVLDPSKNMAFYRRSIIEAVNGKFDKNHPSHTLADKVSTSSGTLLTANSLSVESHHTRHRSLSATGHSLFNDLRSSMTKSSKSNSNSSGSVNNTSSNHSDPVRKIVIPWYPVHKKDLTFFHITQDTLDKNDPSRINWTKIRAIVSKLRELLSYSCESPSNKNHSTLDDSTDNDDNLYRNCSTSVGRQNVTPWYEPVPRRSYPYVEVIHEYKHPMTLPNDSNEPSKELAKRVHCFMLKEKLTKEFLHNSFFKAESILFNEELLMKKSLDLEGAPVSNSSGNVARSSTSNRNINVNVNVAGNCHVTSSKSTGTSATSSVLLSSHKAPADRVDSASGLMSDTMRSKIIPPSREQSSVPTLESMNCNFHGILSGPMKNITTASSAGPVGRTIPTSKFGVTDKTQLNKLLSLTSNSSSSKSTGKSNKHHSHNHHHHHHQHQHQHQHHHHYHGSTHSHAHSAHHLQQQQSQQPQQAQQPASQAQQSQAAQVAAANAQQQQQYLQHSASLIKATIDQSILAPNALYPAQSSSSSSSTCSSTSLQHQSYTGINSSALAAAAASSSTLPYTMSSVAGGNIQAHRAVSHKPCSHHSTDRLSRESSSLGPAFRYPESAHLPSLATARTTSTASVTQQPRQTVSSQTLKASMILPTAHHHRHHPNLQLQQQQQQQASNLSHHRHYHHHHSPTTVTSSSASSTRDSSPLALFGHSAPSNAPNSSDLNVNHTNRSSNIDSTQMLPSYEETIANLRSLRVNTSTMVDASSITLPSAAAVAASSRQRSTSCPRRTTHSRRENLV